MENIFKNGLRGSLCRQWSFILFQNRLIFSLSHLLIVSILFVRYLPSKLFSWLSAHWHMWHTSHCTGRWGPVAASLRHPWGRPHWHRQQTGWLPDMCRGVDPPRCGTWWGDWASHSECVYRTPKNVKRLYLVLHNIRVSVNIYLQFYISTIYLINGAFLILLFGSFQFQLYMECSAGCQI